ncbi:response regulator, partial [Herbaspirillum sp.]
MQAQRHILVVDDHPDICEPLAAYLRRQDLLVSMALDAAQARALLGRQRFDLVVLDVMMPGEDGLSL